MADLDALPALANASASLSSPSKGDTRPIGERIAELDQSQSELMGRLQGLKQELQNWRSKLDNQVKTYKDELLELKKVLNTDLELLTSEFKELRTTLQQQQDDVTSSLKDLGLEDRNSAPEYAVEESEYVKVERVLSNGEAGSSASSPPETVKEG